MHRLLRRQWAKLDANGDDDDDDDEDNNDIDGLGDDQQQLRRMSSHMKVKPTASPAAPVEGTGRAKKGRGCRIKVNLLNFDLENITSIPLLFWGACPPLARKR